MDLWIELLGLKEKLKVCEVAAFAPGKKLAAPRRTHAIMHLSEELAAGN